MAQPARPQKRKGRALHDQEEWLWLEVTKDVRAYRAHGPMSRPPAANEILTPIVSSEVKQPQGGQRTITAASGFTLGTGLDGATAKKLAQGRIAPDATLDLHGMTQDHAHAALERFLDISIRLGRRCVLVITGKGGPATSADAGDAPWGRRRPGILKSLVPLWLEHSIHRGHIASMRGAHTRHGGSGALYLYLRTR